MRTTIFDVMVMFLEVVVVWLFCFCLLTQFLPEKPSVINPFAVIAKIVKERKL